jgi:uncharacterized protein with PIN domain/sulfur carrier protein ThiS
MRCYLRFYAHLKDFLAPDRRQGGHVDHVCEMSTSVKDLIESLGVPHTEVHLILVNGDPVDFAYLVRDGDRISVYPAFESIDISPLVAIQPQPLSEPRFVLDIHLGRLAAYLRMLGLDSLYRNDFADEELARISSVEQRILLTRDRGLLKRSIVTYGYYVRETNPQRQLAEVARKFSLTQAIVPFRRCVHCNGLLKPVAKEAISDRLPARTKQYYDEFRICPDCGKIYWKGSHYERMQRLIEQIARQGE